MGLTQSPLLYVLNPNSTNVTVGNTITLTVLGGSGKGMVIASSDTGNITISGSGSIYTLTAAQAGVCTITIMKVADSTYDAASTTINFVISTSVPCFTADTMIYTPAGEIPVEMLQQGDLVTTASGRVVPVKNVYTSRIAKTTKGTAPYLIPARTYGSAQPRDILLSPLHMLQIRKGVWTNPAIAAKTKSAIHQVSVGEIVEYYHIECPLYLQDNLIANGCVVESFGAQQIDHNPYTYSKRLGGFTRESYGSKSVGK